MTFKYEDYFDAAPSTGYETLIYDCMIGDAILFRAPTASKRAGAWCSRSSTRGAMRGAQGLATYRAGSEGPAEAEQLLARTAAAGGRLREVRHGVRPTSRARRRCGCCRNCRGRGEAARRPRHGGEGPRRACASPAVRAPKGSTVCLPQSRGAARAVGSRALVHRRRPLRPGGRSVEQHGHGAATVSRSRRRAARQHSSDARPTPAIPKRRRNAIRTTEALLWRTSSSIPRGRCSISCSWASAATATPPRCFRTPLRSTRQSAGSSASPMPGLEPFVPRVTLTFPALASTREMLFLVDGAGQTRHPGPRVVRRRPAGAARPRRRRSRLAGRPRRGAGGASCALMRPRTSPAVIVVMGVSGSGKSTIASMLAQRAGLDLRGRRLVSSEIEHREDA